MARAPTSSAHGRTVAVWSVTYLVSYAAARGLSREGLRDRFGLDPASLDDVDGRIPLSIYTRLWNELPELTGDPDMPLHVLEHAVHAEPSLGVLLFLSSPTLGSALSRLWHYQRVTFDLGDEPVGELTIRGEVVHLSLQHEKSVVIPPTGAVVDSMLGLVTMARMATGREVTPVSIALRHPRPAAPEKYRAAFGCPVTFDADRDHLVWRASDLALEHPQASRTLLTIVERHAEGLLAELPTGGDLSLSVRRVLRARLPDGDLTLGAVAAELELSTRTLQRRLAEAGTSLSQLLDDERRDLALHHIQNPRTSVTDIAFRLGFADLSAFTRAFTRWTGRSPRDYRRGLP